MLQLPPLEMAFAVEARGVFGINPVKITLVAGSGPELVRVKVNATGVPAGTGFGDGLPEDAVIVIWLAAALRALIFATNASGGVLIVG